MVKVKSQRRQPITKTIQELLTDLDSQTRKTIQRTVHWVLCPSEEHETDHKPKQLWTLLERNLKRLLKIKTWLTTKR